MSFLKSLVIAGLFAARALPAPAQTLTVESRNDEIAQVLSTSVTSFRSLIGSSYGQQMKLTCDNTSPETAPEQCKGDEWKTMRRALVGNFVCGDVLYDVKNSVLGRPWKHLDAPNQQHHLKIVSDCQRIGAEAQALVDKHKQ